MIFKVTKGISAHLFKYVKKVDIRFNPFDTRTRSARELLRQIQAERYSKANPKLTINIDIVDTIDPPKIDFEYIDGTKTEFDTQYFQVKDMLMEVHSLTSVMDMNYELEGKSVDDL